MLLFILTLIILLVGIGLLIGISCFIRKWEDNIDRYSNPRWQGWEAIDYWQGIVGLIFTVIGGLLMTIELIILSCTRLPIAERQAYEKMVLKKEIIEYRLEHEDAILNGNTDLYEDIYWFNNNLREHKCWSDNIWIGMFHNQKIKDIEYIELPDRGE